MENERFGKKLVSIKSTISARDQDRNFTNHIQRSQRLSKFKINYKTGGSTPKNSAPVEKRMKLEPIHKKLKMMESRAKLTDKSYPKSLSVNLKKLFKN